MKNLTRLDFLHYVGAATLPWVTGMLTAKSKTPLLTAKIPATGQELPRIGLGTYSTFDVAPGSEVTRGNKEAAGMEAIRAASAEIQQVKDVLGEFYALGGRLVDSSPMYGRAEEITGSASLDLGINANLFMATKVWISGRDAGVRQMQDSLAKFRRKKIELMQIHNLVDWRTHIKTLRDQKDRGIYKYIGLTHYMTSAFPELEKIIRAEKLDFLQIPYSLGETSAENRLLGAAAECGAAVIANEPFGQGALFRQIRGKPVPAWAVEKGITSWAQYFLKFIFSNPQVQFAIPATRKIGHLRENMAGGTGYLPTMAERGRMRKEFNGQYL